MSTMQEQKLQVHQKIIPLKILQKKVTNFSIFGPRLQNHCEQDIQPEHKKQITAYLLQVTSSSLVMHQLEVVQRYKMCLVDK